MHPYLSPVPVLRPAVRFRGLFQSKIQNRSTERSRTPSLRDAPRTEKQATRSVPQESPKFKID